MINPLRFTTKKPDYNILHDGSSKWGSWAKAVLVVCSHRMWRGGPRSLLQISAVTLSLLILFYLVPSLLGDDYQTLLSWSNGQPPSSNDLRIVVFGSQDLLGSARDNVHSRATWPEHLCKELKCSSIVSFVPPVDSQPGLTSNILYKDEIEALKQLNKHANITAVPASDKFYVVEKYPVPETPDLEAQIQQFLSMPPPQKAPRETLWVFTFGTWDIWNLASLSRPTGESIIDASVNILFEQIELLYRKSLNPKSIAYSDFWSSVSNDDVDTLTHPDDTKGLDARKLESFRVVIPEILDITLAPGWQKRPLPSMPYTRGVELRNAAHLTERWNTKASDLLEDWRRKKNAKPDKIEEEGIDVVNNGSSPGALRRDQQKQDVDDKRIVYAPYPIRVGLHATFAGNIISTMTEEELQRSSLKDGRGRGSLPLSDPMRFRDVWTPCVTGSGRRSVEMNHTSMGCEAPGDHLFYDDFTLGERASEQLAKKAVEYMHDQGVM
ncbi:hypothetical protein PT974_02687 [Cladobotryum mycophilum]|uniref:Uncharacterized protein n=1 Tax=Cladobotryum mycophilum TaxID=491253 RepID=A0ABR0SYT4_9HYPO